MDELIPCTTADEAWAALVAQQGMSDGDLVDLWNHQTQTAEQLERAGADDELVVAGLLHDLGDGRVSDAEHSAWAAELVRPLLGERVAYVIAAHADAKRYLCTVDPAYWAGLSPLSQQTLLHQGGTMTPEEVEAFRAHPWTEDALTLRRCDDAGKDTDRVVENPERFRALLDRVVARNQPSELSAQRKRDPA